MVMYGYAWQYMATYGDSGIGFFPSGCGRDRVCVGAATTGRGDGDGRAIESY